jgi:phosphate transport system substrate-binding protein
LGGNNAEIILIDLPEDETDKQLMRQHYLGDITITSTAILIPDDDEVLEALITTPYSIGTVPKEEELEQSSVNILSIDGISATPENIRNGEYKLVYTMGMVFATDPTPAIQEFINYIFSEAGQQELAAAGYVVINQP